MSLENFRDLRKCMGTPGLGSAICQAYMTTCSLVESKLRTLVDSS